MSTQASAQLDFASAPAAPAPAAPQSASAAALKQQAAARLAEHRARRAASPNAAPKSTPQPAADNARAARIAASVAERYARAQSYRDFLAAEAEQALRQAEAAAEVAARNAEAIAVERQSLLAELEQSAHNEQQQLLAAERQQTQPAGLAPDFTPQIEFAPQELSQPKFSPESRRVFVPEPQPEEDLSAYEPREVIPPTPLPANLIEFPRVLVAARKARPRLAEGPLREEADHDTQLRIFEVDAQSLSPQPAQPSTAPEWYSIRLDADASTDTEELPQIHAQAFTVPLQTAALRPRVKAFTVDAALVAASTAAFAVAFAALVRHAGGALPEKKPAAIALFGVFLLFHLLYQFLFFTFSESTPGMILARIGLCTFSDENPTRAALRRRIGATLLAACPMGLGLVWAWFDVDRLGWHDRITRTYQRSY